MIFQGFAIKEAIASVAIEHGTGCSCRICRAAAGDLMAFAEVWTEVQDGLERRQGGGPGENTRRAPTRAPGVRARGGNPAEPCQGQDKLPSTKTERRSDG